MSFLRKAAEKLEKAAEVPRWATLTPNEKAELRRRHPVEWQQGCEWAKKWADAQIAEIGKPLAGEVETRVYESIDLAANSWGAKVTNTPAGQQIPGLNGLRVLAFEGSFALHFAEFLGGPSVPQHLRAQVRGVK